MNRIVINSAVSDANLMKSRQNVYLFEHCSTLRASGGGEGGEWNRLLVVKVGALCFFLMNCTLNIVPIILN